MKTPDRLQGVPDNIRRAIEDHQRLRQSIKNGGAGDGWAFTTKLGKLTSVRTDGKTADIRIGTGHKVIKIT